MISFMGTDLDGTLLDSQQNISIENIRAIRLAVDAGITFAICSGRTLDSVAKYFENDLQVPGYKVLLNGAVILDPNNRKISDRPMAKAVVERLLSSVNGYGFKAVIDGLDSTYVTDPELSGSTYYGGVSKRNVVVSSIDELRRINDKPDSVIYKVCFSASEDRLSTLTQKIESFASMPVVVSRSGDTYYEINSLDCTKLSALQRISKVAGIPIREFMCFGDYGNDLEMIRGVGYGVAMDNALPEVKSVADFVTTTNEQHGVASIINKVLTGEIK
ncbi:Cof-type HAD-IIB family hydrolase [Companilactobacillus ginsenosidimutans]|uniref:Haloacid dehalogenase n=1 Tax=Companilactobacillus ginsenosidimutans TaxID=1007676 RepID=A0A0H4QEX3_9LACO|nr:Cof-type HAD-IIB family hydrolase [Companilactobacillus ginsenosidimutans]AKP66482.1 haloacid dehalogenase [Companilactobacillus ginsenosidimutans]